MNRLKFLSSVILSQIELNKKNDLGLKISKKFSSKAVTPEHLLKNLITGSQVHESISNQLSNAYIKSLVKDSVDLSTVEPEGDFMTVKDFQRLKNKFHLNDGEEIGTKFYMNPIMAEILELNERMIELGIPVELSDDVPMQFVILANLDKSICKISKNTAKDFNAEECYSYTREENAFGLNFRITPKFFLAKPNEVVYMKFNK